MMEDKGYIGTVEYDAAEGDAPETPYSAKFNAGCPRQLRAV
jgi:hypothetical protein